MHQKVEEVLKSKSADMVSMARPFLADPEFVNKASLEKSQLIAPCIACNQACLDHTFKGQISSCLVNPRACFERELELKIVSESKNIGIVGGGPAGLSAAHHFQHRTASLGKDGCLEVTRSLQHCRPVSRSHQCYQL